MDLSLSYEFMKLEGIDLISDVSLVLYSSVKPLSMFLDTAQVRLPIKELFKVLNIKSSFLFNKFPAFEIS